MYKRQEKYNLTKLNEEAAESLKRTITPDEIETLIKKLPKHKIPGLDSFTGKFYRAFKGELTLILHKPNFYYKKFKKMEDSQTRFMKPTSS